MEQARTIEEDIRLENIPVCSQALIADWVMYDVAIESHASVKKEHVSGC